MATGIRKMIEEVTCSICLQLMTSPVTIDCGHNFCYVCIENICHKEVTPTMQHARCPLCQASFQRRSLKLNRLLKNLIETIKYMESERLCEEHEEKLQLFCEDDGQLICWRCERSPQHKGHNVDLLEDVCPRYKEELQEIVTKLKNVQDLYENAKLFAKKQITEWKSFAERAMTSIIRKMREEVRCSQCMELMTEPVTLPCGHNFCQDCLENIYETEEATSSPQSENCPKCWAEVKRKKFRPNKQLENLIDIIKEMDCALLCDDHGEQLQLFCKDEGQLICWCCERSLQHKGHNTAPIEAVCPGYQEKIQEILTILKEHQETSESMKLYKRKEITEWEEDIDNQRQKIHTLFRNLHNFIHEEEKLYLCRLENEKDQHLRRLQDDEASMGKQVLEFESHIQELKKRCYGSPQALMEAVEDMKKRFLYVRLKVPEVFYLNPQTGSNLSKLSNDVKKIFKEC